jgi:nucleoside phosphorylase
VTAERAPLVVVTAVAAETRAVLAALRRARRITVRGWRAWEADAEDRPVRLVQAGIGRERAANALRAMPSGQALVVSAGFAGALVPGPASADLVLPTVVSWEEASGLRRYTVPTDVWDATTASVPSDLGVRVWHGTLLSSSTIIGSTADKQVAAERTGAIAVEMEAAGLISVAEQRGAGVVAIRAILDTADISLEGLPPDLDSSWRARAQLAGRPRAWPTVVGLMRQIPAAVVTLTRTMRAVLPRL